MVSYVCAVLSQTKTNLGTFGMFSQARAHKKQSICDGAFNDQIYYFKVFFENCSKFDEATTTALAHVFDSMPNVKNRLNNK